MLELLDLVADAGRHLELQLCRREVHLLGELGDQADQVSPGDAAALRRLTQASRTAADELAAWTGRWSGPAAAPSGTTAPLAVSVVAAPEVEALAEALDRVGEAGAPGITEVFDGRTAERQAAIINARAHLETDLRDAGGRLAGLRTKRDAIAVEQDDAPPASDLRPASREGRPGAPLWRLVRFADGIGDAEAAAVEGALYGAGLLTAWIHPDPALTRAALAAAEGDGYLVPSAQVTGRTLADILVPEDQGHVSPAVINAVLDAPAGELPGRVVLVRRYVGAALEALPGTRRVAFQVIAQMLVRDASRDR